MQSCGVFEGTVAVLGGRDTRCNRVDRRCRQGGQMRIHDETKHRLGHFEKTVLLEFSDYRPADKKADQRAGEKDGNAGVPKLDGESHPFRELQFVRGEAVVQKLRQEVDKLRKDLFARREQLETERNEGFVSQRDTLRTQRADAEKDVERRLGPESQSYSSPRQHFEQAQAVERRVAADAGRPLRIHLRWMFAPIMALVAIAEVPINALAFEAFFQEARGIAVLISLAIGVILALLAHITGLSLKRASHKEGFTANLKYYVGVAVTLCIVGITVYFIALMRDYYIQFTAATSKSFADMLREQSVGQTLGQVSDVTLTSNGLGLMVMNFLIFFVGCVASYFRHDAHPDYETAVRAREKWQRRFERAKSKYEKAMASTLRKFDDKINSLETQIGATDKDLDDLDRAIALTENAVGPAVKLIAARIRERVQVYEHANVRARNGTEPQCFSSLEADEVEARLRAFVGLANGSDGGGRTMGLRAVE